MLRCDAMRAGAGARPWLVAACRVSAGVLVGAGSRLPPRRAGGAAAACAAGPGSGSCRAHLLGVVADVHQRAHDNLGARHKEGGRGKGPVNGAAAARWRARGRRRERLSSGPGRGQAARAGGLPARAASPLP
jgi:hypothetical protein